MKERDRVLAKSDGRCWYCGENLAGTKWHIDHFSPIYRNCGLVTEGRRGDDTFCNKVPSCSACNLFKRTLTLEEFRNEIAQQVERAMKYSVNCRFSVRFGLLQPTGSPVVFYFERVGLNRQPVDGDRS